MSEDSGLIEDDIFGESETTDANAEAQSAPDDLSSDDGSVDLGSQTQPSDAEPTQTEVEAPQTSLDPRLAGQLEFLGVDPSQIPAHMTPDQIVAYGRQRLFEVSQRAAQAERYAAELRHYRSQQAAAQAAPQSPGAQGSAAAAAPEPFDPQKHFEKAWGVPQPPAHMERLADHLVRTPTGRVIAKAGSESLVSPQELDEINAYEKAREEHLRKFLENPHKNIYETMQPAIDRLVEERLAKAQAETAKAQYVQNFAAQVQQHAQDQYGNPTPYGQALMQNLIPLKESGLSHDAKLRIAHNAALGQLAMQQAEQQRLAAYYAQQYGPPPQSQTFNPPAQQFAPNEPPQPQPHTPNFLDVASHSANGSPFGDADEDDWQPKHLGELRERTFGQAARQLARR